MSAELIKDKTGVSQPTLAPKTRLEIEIRAKIPPTERAGVSNRIPHTRKTNPIPPERTGSPRNPPGTREESITLKLRGRTLSSDSAIKGSRSRIGSPREILLAK